MRPGIGAALVPAITATTWDQGFACRIGLFRDWGWIDDEGKTVTDVRLIEVIKAEGVILHTGKAWLVGFSIDEVCSALISIHSTVLRRHTTQVTRNEGLTRNFP